MGLRNSLLVYTALATQLSSVHCQDSFSSPGDSKTQAPHTLVNKEDLLTVHVVAVGKANHEFKPNSIQAAPGDIVSFEFFPTNHSVVKAAYGYPCVPYEYVEPEGEGFFSGFEPVSTISDNPPVWNLTINSTDPIFYYCGAAGSCTDWGMVGAINANASTPLSTQIQLAKEAHFALLPGEPFPDERPESSATQSRTISTANRFITATAGGTENDGAENVLDAKQETNSREEGHGHIIGPVVGGSIVIVAISGLLFWFRRRIVYKASTGDDAASKECFPDSSVQHEHLPGPHLYMAADRNIVSPISELGASECIAELGDDTPQVPQVPRRSSLRKT